MVCAFGSTTASAQTLESIVDSFYPTATLHPVNADSRISCFAVQSSDSAGNAAVIAAAYTDGSNAAIRVIGRSAGGTYRLLADSPSSLSLAGVRCTVEVPDVDRDGVKEMLFGFRGISGPDEAWIFKWSGMAMVNLTPTTSHDSQVVSLLNGPEFVDLYHDGTLQAVSLADDDYPMNVFRLQGGVYVYDSGIISMGQFSVDDDPRVHIIGMFVPKPLSDSAPPLVLHLVNGDSNGQKRVTSGTVRLNDVDVVTPTQLNGTAEFVDATITALGDDNHVSLSISGDAGAHVTVVIKDSTLRTAP